MIPIFRNHFYEANVLRLKPFVKSFLIHEYCVLTNVAFLKILVFAVVIRKYINHPALTVLPCHPSLKSWQSWN